MKSVLLFSGGLDSILAYYVLKLNDIEIYPVVFASIFLKPNEAIESAKRIGIDLNIVDFTEKQMEIIKNPKYGYGKYANPCIDCHAVMIKEAKRIMDELGYNFITTGEVLGERPKSQSLSGINAVDKLTGLRYYTFRPLSAKLLPPTIVQENGWIKEEFLFDISGRSRKKQMELAEKWNVPYYPTPGGGCILTEKVPGTITLDLIKNDIFNKEQIELIGKGRYFVLNDKCRMIVSRNEEESKNLLKIKRDEDIFIKCKDISGPYALCRGNCSKEDALIGAKIMTRYGKNCRNKEVVVEIEPYGEYKVMNMEDEEIEKYRLIV